ncbi:acyltransferase family protein [Prevotella communis]|uniref:acyltransferase family protein n=1 Tax=Prevotella communis TaxID=2913614 RepID=UPI001ED9D932|nr:acyltransferase family protein [Prevotella communis]UKK65183.1 acyltransferase family protein [Prevotella communis]
MAEISFIFKKEIHTATAPILSMGGVLSMKLGQLNFLEIPKRLFVILKDPYIDAPWFLFELFFIQIIYYICCTVSSGCKNRLGLNASLLLSVPVIVILLLIKHRLIGSGYSWVNPMYLCCFIWGHMVQTYSDIKINEKLNMLIIFIAALFFFCIVPFYDFKMEPAYYREAIKLTCSVLFSLVAYAIVKHYYSNIPAKVQGLYNYLGTHTIEIYLTHFCVISICLKCCLDTSMINSIPLLLALYVISIPFALLTIKISDIIKAIPFLSLLLYGKKSLW